MISVIIPTLNTERTLGPTLASLLDANSDGMIREVIVTDGGSTDQTVEMATEAGARLIEGPKGRGPQLQRGAAAARGEWLLFLHADTQLAPDWHIEAARFIARSYDRKAAVFALRFDEPGWRPALVALGANFRAHVLRLPYGDQGLLISRQHYEQLGGFADFPLFEDVDLIRRIVKKGGRGALKVLRSPAITSAERYVAEGYFARVLRNARCLRLYFTGTPPEEIMEIYLGARKKASAGHDGQAAARRSGQDTPGP